MKQWQRILIPLLVALASAAYFYFARHWIPFLAAFMGLALGILGYITLTTLERLVRMYRR